MLLGLDWKVRFSPGQGAAVNAPHLTDSMLGEKLRCPERTGTCLADRQDRRDRAGFHRSVRRVPPVVAGRCEFAACGHRQHESPVGSDSHISSPQVKPLYMASDCRPLRGWSASIAHVAAGQYGCRNPISGQSEASRRETCCCIDMPDGPSNARAAHRSFQKSGRLTSPTSMESPVSTIEGSGLRSGLITSREMSSGRCPGL